MREASAPNMDEVPLPPPAQGIWDSLLLSGANPCLQLLLTQWQECILSPLLWAGGLVASCLLFPTPSLWIDAVSRANCSLSKEGGL